MSRVEECLRELDAAHALLGVMLRRRTRCKELLRLAERVERARGYALDLDLRARRKGRR